MTDLLRQYLGYRLQQLFDQKRVVVWADAPGHLEPLLRDVLPKDVRMPKLEGNLLSLRQEMDREDPWLERKWLLYVPRLPEGVGLEWIADYTQGFSAVEQGDLCWALHEFFHLPDSPDVRSILSGPAAARLAVDFGRYVPQSKGQLAEEDVDLALFRAALELPGKTGMDVVVRYLALPDVGKALDVAGLLPLLTSFVKRFLGLRRHLVDGAGPENGPLARCLVASALVEAKASEAKPLSNHLPQESFRPAWREALEKGLNDPTLAKPLASAIDAALRSSDLLTELSDPVSLARGPALAILDRRIQKLLLERHPAAFSDAPAWWQMVADVAKARIPAHAAGSEGAWTWKGVQAAANLVLRARTRLSDLVGYPAACFPRLAEEYARDSGGDWEIDTLYRSLPQGAHKLEEGFDRWLFTPAREAYQQWVREATRRFVEARERESSPGPKALLPQRRFWSEMVDRGGKRAVLIVDALRADLAHSLAAQLRQSGRTVETQIALAELPTRTEIGMAALLPRADQEFRVDVEKGKLVPSIGSARLPSVNERTKHLESASIQMGRKVTRNEVGEFLKGGAKLLRSCADKGATAVAFTTDLDDGGELAARVSFRLFDEILGTCAEFVDAALAADFEEVVVAADHGFLVRSEDGAEPGVLGVRETTDSFTRSLRYAAGAGEPGPNMVAFNAGQLGREGVTVYVPRDSACVALQGGPGLFVHGGLSLQEAVLVFLRVRRDTAATAPLHVRLTGPEKVSSLTFKVAIVVPGVDLPLLYPPKSVIVRVLGATLQSVFASPPLSIEAGSGENRTDVVVVVPNGGSYSVVLVDAESERRLSSFPVTVEVLGDDFGF